MPRAELTAEDRRFLRLAGYPERPLEILVSSDHERRGGRGIFCRIWAADMPQRSFAKLTDNLYLSSPELTFLQMARSLTLIQLIELGFELCGCYSVGDTTHRRTSRRTPLTSAAKLASYLEKVQGVKGLKKARRAARYVIDGSASPMETKLALIMCLPPAMGGFGFPRAIMNQELRLRLESADAGPRFERVVRCDLYWPAPHNVAIEYDSSEWHLSNQKFAEDAIRRNDLVSAQVRVLTVTKRQILNLLQWPKLAGSVAALMGWKLKTKVKDHAGAQRRLYAELFGALFDEYDRAGYSGQYGE